MRKPEDHLDSASLSSALVFMKKKLRARERRCLTQGQTADYHGFCDFILLCHFDICVALVFFSNSWINCVQEQELPMDGTMVFSTPYTHSSAEFDPFLTWEKLREHWKWAKFETSHSLLLLPGLAGMALLDLPLLPGTLPHISYFPHILHVPKKVLICVFHISVCLCSTRNQCLI